MRRDITAGLKTPTKNNSSNQMLFINILLYAFNDVENWPEVFVKVGVKTEMIILKDFLKCFLL